MSDKLREYLTEGVSFNQIKKMAIRHEYNAVKLGDFVFFQAMGDAPELYDESIHKREGHFWDIYEWEEELVRRKQMS